MVAFFDAVVYVGEVGAEAGDGFEDSLAVRGKGSGSALGYGKFPRGEMFICTGMGRRGL